MVISRVADFIYGKLKHMQLSTISISYYYGYCVDIIISLIMLPLCCVPCPVIL